MHKIADVNSRALPINSLCSNNMRVDCSHSVPVLSERFSFPMV